MEDQCWGVPCNVMCDPCLAKMAEVEELKIKLAAAETERDAALQQLRIQNEKLDRLT